MIRLAVLCLALWLCACSDKTSESILETASVPTFHTNGNPKTLSEWGMLSASSGKLILAKQTIAYDLNTPLFTDYAHKLRTIYIPEGQFVMVSADGDTLDFPVGTIITKTFYYPKGKQTDQVLKTNTSYQGEDYSLPLDQIRLVETRILAHRQDGWIALPYIWNDAQTQATLKRTGDVKRLTLVDGDKTADFAYIVPNTNQCAGCHATNNTSRLIEPIGLKLRHMKSPAGLALNRDLADYMANADWRDETATLDARARAYLDINCSHCHSEVGPADTSGLHLTPETPMGSHLGLCKTPIAAGTGTGNRKFGIAPGEPDESIFVYRMDSDNPAIMMPELGRSLVHGEGVQLISDWIKTLEGDCTPG